MQTCGGWTAVDTKTLFVKHYNIEQKKKIKNLY